jgi:hypothetical protein
MSFIDRRAQNTQMDQAFERQLLASAHADGSAGRSEPFRCALGGSRRAVAIRSRIEGADSREQPHVLGRPGDRSTTACGDRRAS